MTAIFYKQTRASGTCSCIGKENGVPKSGSVRQDIWQEGRAVICKHSIEPTERRLLSQRGGAQIVHVFPTFPPIRITASKLIQVSLFSSNKMLLAPVRITAFLHRAEAKLRKTMEIRNISSNKRALRLLVIESTKTSTQIEKMAQESTLSSQSTEACTQVRSVMLMLLLTQK